MVKAVKEALLYFRHEPRAVEKDPSQRHNHDLYPDIVRDGLWRNNVGLVQLLGLCPLLAVTGTFINGLGLGLATLLTLVASNVTVSLIRSLVRPEVRIPVFVLVIASIVTIIELSISAFSMNFTKCWVFSFP